MRYTIGHGVVGELTSMPGCSQIAISHDVFLPISERGEGKGKAANKKRLQMAAKLGYDMLMCTVDSANFVQREIMRSNGWQCVKWYSSSKTGHKVGLWCIDLDSFKAKPVTHKELYPHQYCKQCGQWIHGPIACCSNLKDPTKTIEGDWFSGNMI